VVSSRFKRFVLPERSRYFVVARAARRVVAGLPTRDAAQ
jgi:hypothetical protein